MGHSQPLFALTSNLPIKTVDFSEIRTRSARWPHDQNHCPRKLRVIELEIMILVNNNLLGIF